MLSGSISIHAEPILKQIAELKQNPSSLDQLRLHRTLKRFDSETAITLALRHPDILAIYITSDFDDYWIEKLSLYPIDCYQEKPRSDLSLFSQTVAAYAYWKSEEASDITLKIKWLLQAQQHGSWRARLKTTQMEHPEYIAGTMPESTIPFTLHWALKIAKTHWVPGHLLLAYTYSYLGVYFSKRDEKKTAELCFDACLQNIYFAERLEQLEKVRTKSDRELFPFIRAARENAYLGKSTSEGFGFGYRSFKEAAEKVSTLFHIPKDRQLLAYETAKKRYKNLIKTALLTPSDVLKKLSQR